MRMVPWFLVLALVSPVACAANPRLEDLGWLTGHWIGDSADGSMEELWLEPRGGLMIGVHRDVKGDRVTSFEFLRIAVATDGSIVYLASPQGRPATEFPLKELTGDRAVFENLKHDFPQRIIYQRRGQNLCARVEGPMDGKVVAEEWCWKRAGSP